MRNPRHACSKPPCDRTFMIELKVVSWMPTASMPTMLGLNSTSGQRKRSLPIVIICEGDGAISDCWKKSILFWW